MEDPGAAVEALCRKFGTLLPKITTPELLPLRARFALLSELPVAAQILTLSNAPPIKLTGRKVPRGFYGYRGEYLSMKNDFLSCVTMQEFLRRELVASGKFPGYEVCDVGFWDLDVATDTGLSWHNDNNWNSALAPNNKTYHGWFVCSCSMDCNSTLAVSADCRYNECNTDFFLGVHDILDDEVMKADLIAPLRANALTLFPVGSAHRTYRFKAPDTLVGSRVIASFILHHEEDAFNEAKLAKLDDEELCRFLARYRLEKALKSGHYMIRLMERHPRIRRLLRTIDPP